MLSNLFLILRHGDTQQNEADEYRGQSDGPDAQLNNEGIWQAREAASFLCQYRTPIRKVVASDLDRTMHTASIVCTILGIPEFDTDKRLRPIDIGDFEGKQKSEHSAKKYTSDKSEKFPNGESIADFEARQSDFGREVVRQIKRGVIMPGELLLVAHSTVIRYWHNLQMNLKTVYMDEKTDLVMPGGIVIVTDDAVLPLHKWEPSAI